MAMATPCGLRALLALAAAAAAAGLVCDEASERKVPCFKLAGGLAVPQVAIGTGAGSYTDCRPNDLTCGKQHARFAVENWLHIGGTHIDGANDYRTQTSIAEALQGSDIPREEVFITTKCPGAMGFEATIQCADDNLQMLGQFGTDGVGYIDLLLVHFPSLMKPRCRFYPSSPECAKLFLPASKAALQDTWRAMEELKRIGVVKSIGVSNHNITQLEGILEVATEPVDLHQVEWNPRHHDEAMLAFCKEHNIQLMGWSPLGGTAGSVLSDPVVKRIAAAHNVTTAQVTLRWALQRGVALVVGTGNAAHAKGDLDIFGFELADDEVATISGLQLPEGGLHI